MEVLLCERVNDNRHCLFHLLNYLKTIAFDFRKKPKVTGKKVCTIWMVRNCRETHLWSNSLWQGWSCGLVHCPGGNATGPIWRVLASSQGISSWTPLKPQHCNPNPNPLANQLWYIEFLTLIFLTDSLPSLNRLCHSKTDARFNHDGPESVWSIPYVSVAFFPSLKPYFIAYRFFLCVLTPRLHFWNSPAVTIRR